MQTSNYIKSSNISYIIDRAEEVENFAQSVLDQAIPKETKLLNRVKRNTNSIKAVVYKYLDTLQRNG